MLELLDAPAGPLVARNPASMTGSPVGGEQQTDAQVGDAARSANAV
jgi:hypothetical protein